MSSTHESNCAYIEGHTEFLLVIRTQNSDAKFVKDMLAAVRSGLASGHEGDDPDYACFYCGPVEIDGAEREIIETVALSRDGILDSDANEPDYIRKRVLLSAFRNIIEGAK